MEPTQGAAAVDALASQVVLAYFASRAIQFMKKSELSIFKWVDEHKKPVLYGLGAVMSAATAVGINYTFDQEAGTLVVTGLNSAAICSAGWEWAKQWAFQQVAYDGVVGKADRKEQ